TLRYYRVYRHTLGTNPANNVLVHEEKDDTFGLYVGRTKSREYIVLASYSTLSSEFRIIPAATPAAAPRVFQQRQQDHEYTIDHAGDYFYIRTNLEAENFRLMRTPVNNTGLAHW